MKNEVSAGGIVFKKVPLTSLKTCGNKVLWLVVQHKGWVFPKGLTTDHDGENDMKQTALREVREEGGIVAKIVHEKPFFNEYWYQYDGERIHKKVYYFLMEYVSGSEKDHDFEISQALWLEEKDVLKKLTFENDKKNFKEAVKVLNSKFPACRQAGKS